MFLKQNTNLTNRQPTNYIATMKLAICFTVLLLPIVAAFDIKVCFEGIDQSPIQEAKVQCYDATSQTDIGSAVYTDAVGCAAVSVGNVSPTDELHCDLEGNGQCFATTTSKKFSFSEVSNDTIDLGIVHVESDIKFCAPHFLEIPSSGGSGQQQLGANSRKLANGCGPGYIPGWLSKVLDIVSGFRRECNIHDYCYAGCTQTRSRCDSRFKTDMRNRCGRLFYTSRPACYALSDLFYKAVRSSGGKTACQNARQARCSITGIRRCGQ